MTKLDPEDRMTQEEWDAVEAAVEADERGDHEAASKHRKKLRLLPGSLKVMKEDYGADYIRQQGFNTALADKHFGAGWLDR